MAFLDSIGNFFNTLLNTKLPQGVNTSQISQLPLSNNTILSNQGSLNNLSQTGAGTIFSQNNPTQTTGGAQGFVNQQGQFQLTNPAPSPASVPQVQDQNNPMQNLNNPVQNTGFGGSNLQDIFNQFGSLSPQAKQFFGIGLTPGQQTQFSALQESLQRQIALQEQLAKVNAPTELQTQVNQQIAGIQNQLNNLNPVDFLRNNPNLLNVGITSGQLQGTLETQREPLAAGLAHFLTSKSILGQEQERQIRGVQTQIEALQNETTLRQSLAQLQTTAAGVLPQEIRQKLLENMLVPSNPAIQEYNQALSRGLIPQGTDFQTAQFLLHPESRFGLQQLIDPLTKLPVTKVIDKLQLLNQGREGVGVPTEGTEGFKQGVQPLGVEDQRKQLRLATLPLDPTERESVDNTIIALKNAQDLMGFIPKVITGKGIGGLQQFLQGIPALGKLVPSNFNKFNTLVTDFRANYIKSLGGVRALTPAEQKLLGQATPSENKITKVNIDALQALAGNMENRIQALTGINPGQLPDIIPSISDKSFGINQQKQFIVKNKQGKSINLNQFEKGRISNFVGQ